MLKGPSTLRLWSGLAGILHKMEGESSEVFQAC